MAILSCFAIFATGCIQNTDQFSAADVALDADAEQDTETGEDIAEDTVSPPDAEDVDGGDTGDTDESCPTVDAEQFCPQNDLECGAVQHVDSCGNLHELDCGGCPDDGACDDGICQPATCDDGLKNQDETDVDCGGSECPPCQLGQACEEDSDCAEGGCDADGVCNWMRSEDGLLALYTFDEGSGATVGDKSGTGDAVDLGLEGAVQWGPDCDCLHFSGGLLRSSNPAEIHDAIVADPQQFTIEAWIAPQNVTQSGPARIITLTHPTTRNPQNLIFGQGGASFALRLYNEGSDTTGPQQNFANAFDANILRHYVVTAVDNEIRLFVNGVPHGEPQALNTSLAWDPNHDLLFGNDVDWTRPWHGAMHLAAIYDRPLTDDEIYENFQAGHQNQ